MMDLPPVVYAQAPPICIQQTAQKYRIPESILVGILVVEGGRPGHTHRNSDGSVDIGPMQINSRWLGTVRKYGISYGELKNSPCTNLDVGGWILSRSIRNHAGRLWEGVGAYHSPHRREAMKYAWKVYRVIHAWTKRRWNVFVATRR